MSAHRYVWLTCDGQDTEDGKPSGPCCPSHTFHDVIVPGSSPRTVAQAEKHRHRIKGGGHLCPECWAEGQRVAFTPEMQA